MTSQSQAEKLKEKQNIQHALIEGTGLMLLS